VTARLEPGLALARPDEYYQFERLGYFALDPESKIPNAKSGNRRLVFNRTLTLRDTWAKPAGQK